MTTLKAFALLAACVAGLACEGSKAINEPGGQPGTGGANPAGTGGTTLPAVTGGSVGTAGGNSGAIGAGGGAGSTGALPLCTGERGSFWPGAATAKSIVWSGSDTQLLELQERTPDGWMVSLVGAPTGTALEELRDDGMLSGFKVGDRIKAIGRQDCQSFSGCKSFSVFREATTDLLIGATFSHSPAALPAFAEAVGIPLGLEATCSFPPATNCYVDEVQTYYRVAIGGDAQVRLDRKSSAPFSVGGRPYTAWLGEAGTATGPSFATPGCNDAGSFWASGALQLAITPGANQSAQRTR